MKKKLQKSISALLVVLLIIPCVLIGVSAQTAAPERSAAGVMQTDAAKFTEKPELNAPGVDYPEIIADKAGDHAARLYYKEEMNTLVYVNDDGAETLYMFGMNVKYTDESGEIKDKSTKLALSEEGYYNPDNDIRVTFAKDLENGVSVTYNDIVISVRPAELKESVKQAELRKIALPEEDGRERVVYADAFEKSDIVYTPTFDGFKEDIVVNSYNGVSEYVFAAFTENARIEGHDIFRGEERIGDIGAIYVLDSEGECTYGVLETEETEPGEYLLTVSVDPVFLENAAYPVYIDPSITIYSYSSGPKLIEDAPVYSGSSSANGGNKYNYCGYVSSSLGYGRVLYRLIGLTSDYTYNQISASQINSVILHLREASGKSGSATVTARPFLETWTESTVKYSNVNINNYNTNSTYAASKTYSSSPKWWEFEIKETVKAWKNNTFNSWYGIVLINSNESSSTYYRNFLSTEYTNSSYYPYITMDYTPNIVVSPSTKTVYVGETFHLSANTYPGGISYTWGSSNANVATVSSTGKVTAVGAGTVTITANGGSNGSGQCVVTVLLPGVFLSDYTKTISIGDSFQLSASTMPVGDTIDFTVTQNGSIVSVPGMGSSVGVLGLSEGTATVTATTSRGATASCTVTVTPRFNVSPTSIVLGLDDYEVIEADCVPAPDSTHPVTWSVTSGSSHISIDPDGTECAVSPLSLGTSTITATYRGITRTINVEVRVLRDCYYFIESKECLMYLQIDDDEGPNYSTENAITEIYPLDCQQYQLWQITHRGNGYYSIISPISGKALSIDADEIYSTDESVILQTYQGLDRQLWKITMNSSGSYKIKAKSAESYITDDLVMAVGSYNIFSGPADTDVEQRVYSNNSDYKDEWFFVRMLPTNGSEIVYSISDWSGVVSDNCNCYAYAINNQVKEPAGNEIWRKQQPGEYYNKHRNGGDEIDEGFQSQDGIVSAVEADFDKYNSVNNASVGFISIGRFETCPVGYYKVALVVSANDYHWYRQDSDGLWSHKQGTTAVKRIDDISGAIIDPFYADRGTYTTFVGYFAVKPWNNMYVPSRTNMGDPCNNCNMQIDETALETIEIGMSLNTVIELLGSFGEDIGSGIVLQKYITNNRNTYYIEYESVCGEFVVKSITLGEE